MHENDEGIKSTWWYQSGLTMGQAMAMTEEEYAWNEAQFDLEQGD